MTRSQTLLAGFLLFVTTQVGAQPAALGLCYRNIVNDAHKLFMINAEHKLENGAVRYICFEDGMRVEFVDYYHSKGFFHNVKKTARMHFLRDAERKASVDGALVTFEIKGIMRANPTISSMNDRLRFTGQIEGTTIEGTASIVGMVMDIKKMMEGRNIDPSDFGDKELESSAIRLELETDQEVLASIRLRK